VSGETKWTQGPWSAEHLALTGKAAMKEYVGECVDKGGADFYAVLVEKPDGRYDVCHAGNGPTSAANAALCAAAPDLYAALERLRAEVITNPAVVLWPESMRDALTDAVAALARARGEVTP
jgi:hypothetical protein